LYRRTHGSQAFSVRKKAFLIITTSGDYQTSETVPGGARHLSPHTIADYLNTLSSKIKGKDDKIEVVDIENGNYMSSDRNQASQPEEKRSSLLGDL